MENLSSAGLPRKKTCSNTLYGTFIKVYVAGEYSRVGGEDAWNDMLDEYASLLKTENSDKAFDIWKQIMFCQWRLKVVEVAMSEGGLRDMYKPKLAEAVAEAGFDLIENIEDDKLYQKQLDLILNEAGSVVVRLNQLYIQYNLMQPKGGESGAPKQEIDFDKELVILAKQGYKVNKRKQYVMEYCAAVNAFFDEIKRHKQQKSK